MKTVFTMPRNPLDGVDCFLRVAAHRSFRAAADEMGVSPSAISQSIRTLEDRIGVPLFIRTTRSVGLTESGLRFHAQAAPAWAGCTKGAVAGAGGWLLNAPGMPAAGGVPLPVSEVSWLRIAVVGAGLGR